MNNLYTLRFWIYIVGSEPYFCGGIDVLWANKVHFYWIIESAKKWIMECVNEHSVFSKSDFWERAHRFWKIQFSIFFCNKKCECNFVTYEIFRNRTRHFGEWRFLFGRKLALSGKIAFIFGKKDSFLGKSIHFWEKTPPFGEKFSLFGKGEALCRKRITKDVVVNVNIKMIKKVENKNVHFPRFIPQFVLP